jgi:microcystin-dependent protein
MSQATIVMPDSSTVSGIVMKSDLDPALAAISTLNAGDTDPGKGPGAYALWADTGNNKLKQRNSANSAWITLCDLGAALAALVGDAGQAFNVADATEDSQAVSLSQLNTAIAAVQSVAEAAKAAAETAQTVADSAATAANPAGTIIASGNAAAPAGYLLCDGSAISRTSYANLFSAIGTAFGTGDGSTTFNLPDLRGVVLRGVDGSRGLDRDRVLGSYQADAIASHKITITDPGHLHTLGNLKNSTNGAQVSYTQVASHGASGSADKVTDTQVTGIAAAYVGDSETRMKNVAINYYIKS